MTHIVDPTITPATWQNAANRIALAITIVLIAALAVSAGIYAGSMAAVATAATAAFVGLGATLTVREPLIAYAR